MSNARASLAALLLVAVTALTACSGGDGGSGDGADPADRLTAARKTLDDASSIRLSLKTDALPSGTKGLLEADGVGTHAPAFDGTVKVQVGGIPVNADVVSVDGQVQAKTGFSPKFVPVDPASLGAPDPAALIAADGGVSALLTTTDDLEMGDKTRDGSEVLTTITGTVPGSEITGLIPTAQKDTTFEATYRLTDDDVLHDATLTGLFYPADDTVTYHLELEASDTSVEITAP